MMVGNALDHHLSSKTRFLRKLQITEISWIGLWTNSEHVMHQVHQGCADVLYLASLNHTCTTRRALAHFQVPALSAQLSSNLAY